MEDEPAGSLSGAEVVSGTLPMDDSRTADLPEGVFRTAQVETTYFGGTVWDPVDGRWEALEDSCWTFDSGVGSHFQHPPGSFKAQVAPYLHESMEGWTGRDLRQADEQHFRRLTETDFLGTPCVGANAPCGQLGGTGSLYAGLLAGEADSKCWVSSGYGNKWDVAISKTFAYTSGSVTLEFDYCVDLEPGADFAYVVIDTTGSGSCCSGAGPDPVMVASYTGSSGGHETINLTPGVDLPATPSNITICFTVETDGSNSDEDGGYTSSCGAMAVDNVSLSGSITSFDDFEVDDNGWVATPCQLGEDWSTLVHLNDLPAPLSSCTCCLSDSVLIFRDDLEPGHGPGQNNVAVSPVIEIPPHLAGVPGKFVNLCLYADLPLQDYVFAQVMVQWYPYQCSPSSPITWSPLTADYVYYFEEPYCPGSGQSRRYDFSHIIPDDAEQVRIAVGVTNLCSFYSNCTGISNSTPWFDNVCLGVYGDQTSGGNFCALLNTLPIDRPQDAFPKDGTLDPASPGRVDQSGIAASSGAPPHYGPYTATGDTLVVRGAADDIEVRVQFAVRPGPEIATTPYQNWLFSHQSEGSWCGVDWYSARMDTAQLGCSIVPGVWMTAYHEDDPNFIGSDCDLDPGDLDPSGEMTRLANDIFPDDLFTPGSRIMLFYKSRPVTGGEWCVHPDTTGCNYFEMEVLPSSMESNGDQNCILYVDDYDGYGAQEPIEDALASIIPGGSANFENVRWDRYDLGASGEGHVTLGRPSGTHYGATVQQLLGYDTIIYNCGDLRDFLITPFDAEALAPWLALVGENNMLYASGNNLARDMKENYPGFGAPITLLNDYFGVDYVCDAVREAGCPPGTPEDLVACIDGEPVLASNGAHFDGSPGSDYVVFEGNGCPQERNFDVIDLFVGSLGNPKGNERYQGPVKGDVDFESISNQASGGPDFKTVFDGASVHWRRLRGTGPDYCTTDVSPIEDRLCRVLTWFGSCGIGACGDTTVTLCGVKFNDENGNGVRDTGEPGLSGWKMLLYSGFTAIDSVFTASDGSYCFTGLDPGTYRVLETPQAGWVQTLPAQVFHEPTVGVGETVTGLDFGNWFTSCEDSIQVSASVGIPDDFDTSDGPEDLDPSSELVAASCSNPSTLADECVANRCVIHTFDGFAPDHPESCMVVGATLTVRLAACGGNTSNDALQFHEDGVKVWGKRIRRTRNVLNGEPDSWAAGDTTTLVLDLADLPDAGTGATNILAALQDGDLDVLVQDETTLDFLWLDVTYCCPLSPPNCTVPPKGLCAWWPGDSGHSHARDLVRPRAQGNLVQPVSYGPGKVGSAFHLGSGGYIEIPDEPKIKPHFPDYAITIDAWVQISNADDYVMIFQKYDGTYGYQLYTCGGGAFGFTLDGQNGSAGLCFGVWPPFIVADGEPHLISLHLDSNEMRIYKDGNLMFVDDISSLGSLRNPAPLQIGGAPGYESADWVDEIEFFGRFLSQDEIRTIRDARPDGKCREYCYVSPRKRCRVFGYFQHNARISASICNDTDQSRTYEWEIVGLPTGPDCELSGLGFNPQQGSVTVPAGACRIIYPIVASCPLSGNLGDRACYEMRIRRATDPPGFIRMNCTGQVIKSSFWGVYTDENTPVGGIYPAQFDDNDTTTVTSVDVPFTVTNLSDPSGSLNWEIQLESQDGDTTHETIAFDGLPPNTPITGTSNVAIGDTVVITPRVIFQACQPFRFYHVFFAHEVNGQMTRVASAGIRSAESFQVVGVDQDRRLPPGQLRALRVVPNPFRSGTSILFQLEQATEVQVDVIDVQGRLVRRLHSGLLPSGPREIRWDGRGDDGTRVASGLYFIHVDSDEHDLIRKVMLVR